MVIDIAFLVAITAFFKEQLELKGKAVLAAAFCVGLVLYLAPMFAAAFPAAQPWLQGVFDFIKMFLAAAGSFDLVVNIGAVIARKARTD